MRIVFMKILWNDLEPEDNGCQLFEFRTFESFENNKVNSLFAFGVEAFKYSSGKFK